MGYYSDASLCLSRTGVALLRQRLENAEPELRNEVESLLDYADSHYLDASREAEFWWWNDIKWYPDFEDIGFVEALLRELDAADYLFLRIGEEVDDTERLGCYLDNPFNIHLVRSIQYSGPEETINGNR